MFRLVVAFFGIEEDNDIVFFNPEEGRIYHIEKDILRLSLALNIISYEISPIE